MTVQESTMVPSWTVAEYKEQKALEEKYARYEALVQDIKFS